MIVVGLFLVKVGWASCDIRALALKNAKVISKVLLAFQGSKTCTSRNGKAHYCKFFCNSATVQF